MEEREWKLGVDLSRADNLLDPITFGDVMLALRCNCSVIDEESFNRTLNESMRMRMDDFRELLRRNKKLMIDFVRCEKDGWSE